MCPDRGLCTCSVPHASMVCRVRRTGTDVPQAVSFNHCHSILILMYRYTNYPYKEWLLLGPYINKEWLLLGPYINKEWLLLGPYINKEW